MAEKYSITKKDEVYNLLKNKRNFEYMSEPLLRQLINVMKVVRFREERFLIKQGAENAFCYIIIRGSVSVYVDGKFLYKLRRTGDVFGEISFVTQSISTATIKADKDLGVMVISYNFFNKLKNIELALWLARVIGEKLIRTSKIKSEETASVIEAPIIQQETTSGDLSESSEIALDQPSADGEAFSEPQLPPEEESDFSPVESGQETGLEETVSESAEAIVEINDETPVESTHLENGNKGVDAEPASEEIIDLESDIFD